PNAYTPHQPGSIDETHLIQDTPWGRKAHGDRTQGLNAAERFSHTAQAEGVRARQHGRRQGTQDRAPGQARKYRIIAHSQGWTSSDTSELLYTWLAVGAHQMVASRPILLAGDVHPGYHGKPPCALGLLSCHALSGLANATRAGKGDMAPLPR